MDEASSSHYMYFSSSGSGGVLWKSTSNYRRILLFFLAWWDMLFIQSHRWQELVAGPSNSLPRYPILPATPPISPTHTPLSSWTSTDLYFYPCHGSLHQLSANFIPFSTFLSALPPSLSRHSLGSWICMRWGRLSVTRIQGSLFSMVCSSIETHTQLLESK